MKLLLTRSLKGILAVTAGCLVLGLFLAIVIYVQIPSKEKMRGCLVTEMYKVHLCPGSKDYVSLNKVSKHLQEAIVLTEDSAFWDHHGFDFQEIQNSFEKNLAQGRFARGGSTLTQQLAKNMFLSAEKSLQRKVLEAVITLRLEKNLSKKEILERYLNVVQFGKDIFGVKEAAQFYFKKSPANLDVVESAFLAFLLPSPEKYSVSFYKKQLTPFAKKRLLQISSSMYKYGRIQPADYRMALGRVNSFLIGGASHPVPEGLDLNAPEDIVDGNWQDNEDQVFIEEIPANAQAPAVENSDMSEEEKSLLQSSIHSDNGPSGEDDSQNQENSEIYEKSRTDFPKAQ